VQTALPKIEWKSIRVKENSVFHGVSSNFHKMKVTCEIFWQHGCHSRTEADCFSSFFMLPMHVSKLISAEVA